MNQFLNRTINWFRIILANTSRYTAYFGAVSVNLHHYPMRLTKDFYRTNLLIPSLWKPESNTIIDASAVSSRNIGIAGDQLESTAETLFHIRLNTVWYKIVDYLFISASSECIIAMSRIWALNHGSAQCILIFVPVN